MHVIKPDRIVIIHSRNDGAVCAITKSNKAIPVKKYELHIRHRWPGLYEKLDPNLKYGIYAVDAFVSPRLKGYKCLKKEI